MPRRSILIDLEETYDLDLRGEATRLRGQGLSEQKIADRLNELVAEAHAKEPPDDGAEPPRIDKQVINRLFKSPTEAKARKAVVEADRRRGAKVVRAELDVIARLQKVLGKLDNQLDLVTTVQKGERPDTGELAEVARAMAPHLRLVVDIQDRLWVHGQYQRALGAILAAVQRHCTTEQFLGIIRDLESDPVVRQMMQFARDGGSSGEGADS